jgi:outer membrane protein OmpA-like peptidoglycan-associated protein/tetratricopeptide (TPR) repeat protein
MKNLFRGIALCAALSFSFIGAAQYDPSKVAKKAVEAYNKGIEKAQDGKYPDALALLNEAITRDPKYVDAYLSIAGIYGQMKNNAQSVTFYEKALALDSNYTSDFRLPYSINLAGLGQFEKAYAVISALLAQPKLTANTRKAAEYRRATYQFALDFEKKYPARDYVFKPVNMGDGINSAESEYFPSLPIRGNEMVFTRRLNNFNEDFFIAEKASSSWASARRLSGSINTPQNEGAQNISQDGLWLVFTACNREDGFGSCDLYISYLAKEGWGEAVNLGKKVNTESWDSQPCLSPDKRDLFFASSRAGGFGGSDIYVSHLLPNGTWSAAENLGPTINTPADESSPFMHADNQTLYFTSNGHPGYGEQDLYFVKKGAPGKWTTPQNLGYPINTINHEGTLFIAADGKTAYYSSDRSDTKGGLDIYTFELRESMRPSRTLWVQGKVFDQKTGAGLPSAVELIDLGSRLIVSKVQTDEKGEYLITLPVGRDYAFNVNRRGYLFYSDNYSLKDKAPDSTYQKDIPLQPLEVNAAIVLRNIFFDFNKFELKPESQVELDRLVQLLQDNPTVKIQIEGHTDNIGKAADNQKLSENRARAVVAYLVSKGINAPRLVAKGFGATRSIADNKTEEGRAQNRRTEVKVIGK